jgi:2-polyprenyl-6-methoxyphenol hydroxylase-like FAD-dependent oxidoreductase
MPVSRKLHVLIAGGGLGGLCLAQGLLKAGHSVGVYERDADLDRKVGYRLHMNGAGGNALQACLPDDLYELYLETSRKNPPRGLSVVVDDQLNELSSMPHMGPPNEGERPHTAVHRKVLRQILLARLGDSVHFGNAAVGYSEQPGGVRLHLADGASVQGDVLVGADGIRSPIRAQRLPNVEVVEAGIEGLGLYARSALPPEVLESLPSTLLDGFVIATNKRGGLLALGAFIPRRPIAEAAAAIAPGVAVDDVEDYMMVSGSVAPGTVIPPAREWTDDTPAQLQASMLQAVEGWHPALRGVVERIDHDTMFAISFGRLDPTPAWEPSRVTLIGDAIHAMLPTLGQGANMALADAGSLAAQLADAEDPVAAIGAYEQEMRARVDPILELAADHSNFGGGGLARKPAEAPSS